MSDGPPKKPGDQSGETASPSEREFKAFVRRILAVPKTEVEKRKTRKLEGKRKPQKGDSA